MSGRYEVREFGDGTYSYVWDYDEGIVVWVSAHGVVTEALCDDLNERASAPEREAEYQRTWETYRGDR